MNSSFLRRGVVPASCVIAGVGLAIGAMALFPGAPRRPADSREEAPEPRLSWRDLESEDPARFAANLRAIGCPEDTILEIVRRDEEAPMPGSAPPSPVAEASRPPEIPAMVSAPQLPVAASMVAPSAPAGPELVIVAPQGRVPLPVAFQEMPQDVQMTATDRAKLNAIQEEFLAAIGGADQDPASPEYLARWRHAQPKCDEALRAAFGQAAFIRRHMAMLQALSSPAPGS